MAQTQDRQNQDYVEELSYDPEFIRETEHGLVSTEQFRKESDLY